MDSRLVWFCLRYKALCKREAAGTATWDTVNDALNDFLYHCSVLRVKSIDVYNQVEVSDGIVNAE
jgi:hypothetical protein